MTLDELYEAIRMEVNKGTAFDSILERKVFTAIQAIEAKYQLKYMEDYVTFQLNPEDENPRTLSLPARLKSFIFVRIAEDDGSYVYIPQIDATAVSANDEGAPTGYWVDGTSYMWLDNTPTEPNEMEMAYLGYTDLEALSGDKTHWLFDNACNAILGQTMLYLIPTMREPTLYPLYQQMRAEGVDTMLTADEELRASNRDLSMEYY